MLNEAFLAEFKQYVINECQAGKEIDRVLPDILVQLNSSEKTNLGFTGYQILDHGESIMVCLLFVVKSDQRNTGKSDFTILKKDLRSKAEDLAKASRWAMMILD